MASTIGCKIVCTRLSLLPLCTVTEDEANHVCNCYTKYQTLNLASFQSPCCHRLCLCLVMVPLVKILKNSLLCLSGQSHKRMLCLCVCQSVNTSAIQVGIDNYLLWLNLFYSFVLAWFAYLDCCCWRSEFIWRSQLIAYCNLCLYYRIT